MYSNIHNIISNLEINDCNKKYVTSDNQTSSNLKLKLKYSAS